MPATLARADWLSAAPPLGSGCHRYCFIFEDGNGDQVTYPDTGSLGLGPASAARMAVGVVRRLRRGRGTTSSGGAGGEGGSGGGRVDGRGEAATGAPALLLALGLLRRRRARRRG